jgi:hypothetical protein
MFTFLRARGALFAPAVLVSIALTAHAQSFAVLPYPPDSTNAQALGVSSNGRFACGDSIDDLTGLTVATVWDLQTGAVWQLPVYGADFPNIAYAVSDSGTIVAGEGDGQAIIWGGAPTGDALLGPGAVLDLSFDGQFAVGYVYGTSGDTVGIRRSADGSIMLLPPEGIDQSSTASAVNDDGSVVVGSTSRFEEDGTTFSRACTWTAGVPQPLPWPSGHTIAGALDCDNQAEKIVGLSACCAETPALPALWQLGGVTLLEGTEFGVARGVSSVAVGEGFGGACVWPATGGIRYLIPLLGEGGADVTGYSLVSAEAISSGTDVVGWGFNQGTGATIAWAVNLNFCLADLDGSYFVDLNDLAHLLAHYGQVDGATLEDGDIDGDGDVDLTDLATLLSRFGLACHTF